MINILNTLNNYEPISTEIKFLPKSLIRLSVLKTLYESPMNMKDINEKTKLNYSAISNTIHTLELAGHIYFENNCYFLSNSMRICIGNILKLGSLMILLDEISPIIQNHVVNELTFDSIYDFHYLKNINLIESDGLNVYKTYEIIEKSIMNSEYVHAILPFSYNDFNDSFNKILKKNICVELISPLNIKNNILRRINSSNDNFTINFFDFDGINAFLLVCTDKKMMLGFFKDDGSYDQNRLLTSTDDDCIKWANNLFESFKKENI